MVTIAVAFLVAYTQMVAGRFSATVADVALRDRRIVSQLCATGGVLALIGVAALILSLPFPHPSLPGVSHNNSRLLVAVAALSGVGLSVVLIARMIGVLRTYGNPIVMATQVLRHIRPSDIRSAAMADVPAAGIGGRPLLSIYELCNQAVLDGDRVALQAAVDELHRHWKDWIVCEGAEAVAIQIANYVVDELLVNLREVIRLRGVPSQYRSLLPQTVNLAIELAPSHPNVVRILVNYLEAALVELLVLDVDGPLAPSVEGLFQLEAASRPYDLSARVHQILGSVGRAAARLVPKEVSLVVDAPGFAYRDPSRSPVVDAIANGFWSMTKECVEATEPLTMDDIWIEAMGATAEDLIARSNEKSSGSVLEPLISGLIGNVTKTCVHLAASGEERPVIVGLIVMRRITHRKLSREMEEAWYEVCLGAALLGSLAIQFNLSGTFRESLVEDAIAMLEDSPIERVTSRDH